VNRRDQARWRILGLIARIDRLIEAQLNEILHHERFQALEGAWRGLRYLTGQFSSHDDDVRVRVLTVSWKELRKDVRAPDFDQSAIFSKVYLEQLAMPGRASGELREWGPFGVLLGVYEIGDHRDDWGTLKGLSSIAATAFAPMIVGAAPSLLGLEHFTDLEPHHDMTRHFGSRRFQEWTELRRREDSRFIGLIGPRVLLRRSYEDTEETGTPFAFAEASTGEDGSDLLWGSPVFAYGAVLIRAFMETGSFTDIRGVRVGELGAGRLHDLARRDFGLEPEGLGSVFPIETAVSERIERELSQSGIMMLSRLPFSEDAAVFSDVTLNSPQAGSNPDAKASAELSARLRHVLAASRVAQCLKILARDMVGRVADSDTLARNLNDWLSRFTAADDDPDFATRTTYPFREAEVEVARTDTLGFYECVVRLRPHAEVDGLAGTIQLQTSLAGDA